MRNSVTIVMFNSPASTFCKCFMSSDICSAASSVQRRCRRSLRTLAPRRASSAALALGFFELARRTLVTTAAQSHAAQSLHVIEDGTYGTENCT